MQTDVVIIGCNGYVAAINTSTGEELWRTKLWTSLLGGSRGLDVTVLIDGGKIYAGCSGRIFALNVTDGAVLWENELSGIGYNEVALAKQGNNTQFVTRVEYRNSNSGT